MRSEIVHNTSHVITSTPGCIIKQPRLKRLGFALLFSMCACSPAMSGAESLYTSIKAGDCRKPSTSIVAFYESRGLTAEECKAADGWRLFVVSSDERSWLELARDRTLWSSEEQVVNRNEFGNFPNIGSEKVEWQMTKTNSPASLIFRITAQDPANINKNLSRLFVIGIRDNTPHFCGAVKTNKEARALAEGTSSCSIDLQIKELPK